MVSAEVKPNASEGSGGLHTWGPAVGVDQPLSAPGSPNRCGSGANKGDGGCELRRKTGAIVGICDHRKVLCHVNPGDEDGFDVATMKWASERYPGIIMSLRVFFKDGLVFNVLPICVVICNQRRPLFFGEFKRDVGAGF
jgi:hypothetical protein